jgi:hypothetical protein
MKVCVIKVETGRLMAKGYNHSSAATKLRRNVETTILQPVS